MCVSVLYHGGSNVIVESADARQELDTGSIEINTDPIDNIIPSPLQLNTKVVNIKFVMATNEMHGVNLNYQKEIYIIHCQKPTENKRIKENNVPWLVQQGDLERDEQWKWRLSIPDRPRQAQQQPGQNQHS